MAARQVDEHLLKRHAADIHIQPVCAAAQRIQAAAHAGRAAAAQALFVDDLQPGAGAGHVLVPARNIVELGHEAFAVACLDDTAVVDKNNILKHARGFLDDMGGDDEGASRFGVIGQKHIVELFPRHHIQAGHRLREW